MGALVYEEAAALCERALEQRSRASAGCCGARRGAAATVSRTRGVRRARRPPDRTIHRGAGARRARPQRARGHDHRGQRADRRADRARAGRLPARASAAGSAAGPARDRDLLRLARRPSARRLVDEAVELARRVERAALLDALNARHAALWSAEYLDERERTARRDGRAGEPSRRPRARVAGPQLARPRPATSAATWRACSGSRRAREALAERLRLPAYTWWGADVARLGGDPRGTLRGGRSG